jgi:hypothetical protein
MTNQYLQAFNNQFEELLDDICLIFPNDVQIETALNALKKLRKLNPKMIIRVFNENINLPYGKQICENNNLQYFLEKDYTSDLSSYKNNDEILLKINSLKEPISQMNQEEQEKVLKYFKNLCKLCDLYN